MDKKVLILSIIFLITIVSCAQNKNEKGNETSEKFLIQDSLQNEQLITNDDSIKGVGLIDLGNQWLELDSNDYNGWVSVASGYAMQKKYIEACDYFKKGYSINGKDSFYLVYNYALCLNNLKKYNTSVEILKNFKNYKLNNDILYLLILSLYELEKYNEVLAFQKHITTEYENLNQIKITAALSLLKLHSSDNKICNELKGIKKDDLPEELKNICYKGQ
jgi:tetratricopeptide (TPR) repeat protein